MNTVDKLTDSQIPPLSVQAGSGALLQCLLDPHPPDLSSKAEVAHLPSSSQCHLKTERLGTGVERSIGTT